MTLAEARRLRDFLHSQKIRATVPLGYAPDGYFVRAVTYRGTMDLRSPSEWNACGVKGKDRQ